MTSGLSLTRSLRELGLSASDAYVLDVFDLIERTPNKRIVLTAKALAWLANPMHNVEQISPRNAIDQLELAA